ncbi:hypothetical protein ABFS82_04G110100 [Erythranthe guttata]|uniref:poly(A)-specific ribonuclease n=1 Tax=Erythranthe guttata TaxID=4155 RepID=A0A022QDN4_ERYGU|nr:PREDICTED: probable CCR4-associated factor 1 homolog 7 [Erythranthe guttata]EYU24605.1 hypothetical protein MIMGU_mgv1a011876mg [Erythranthe guttata]|eukprot:XP_012852654.1 PREDICTED: probable CCR4-associated factor 1 homolog 7 [Erythranthe guttata]
MYLQPPADSIDFREVWAENLDKEFEIIRSIIDDYYCVAMDTEFPGVILKPLRIFPNTNEENYQCLKENVNTMKLIQLGLTLTNEKGDLPTCGETGLFIVWQFNFRDFNPSEDIYNSDSIHLLRGCGIDFEKHVAEGVDATRFAELLMSSGVVLNESVYWVTFQCGHDFGYLLKLLTGRELPETREEFFKFIKLYFPVIYDIKHMIQFVELYGGLNKVARTLKVDRVGTSHQAGSDSLLTSSVFRTLRDTRLQESIETYAGVMHGLGIN